MVLRTTVALVAIPTFLASASHALVEVEPRASATSTPHVNEATCDGRQFMYQWLEDRFGDTMAVPLLLIGSH